MVHGGFWQVKARRNLVPYTPLANYECRLACGAAQEPEPTFVRAQRPLHSLKLAGMVRDPPLSIPVGQNTAQPCLPVIGPSAAGAHILWPPHPIPIPIPIPFLKSKRYFEP